MKQAQATAKDVALWMVDELKSQIHLYQNTVVFDIEIKFGDAFTYVNENGNSGIAKDVLTHFNKLTGNSLVWERRQKMRRPRESHDEPGRMQR